MPLGQLPFDRMQHAQHYLKECVATYRTMGINALGQFPFDRMQHAQQKAQECVA